MKAPDSGSRAVGYTTRSVGIAVSPEYGYLRSLRKAARAAQYPHIPCTPPPGGVEDEQM